MDKKRRAAWEAAIAKLDRGEQVPAEEHYALLRKDMFKGVSKVEANDEAALFLRYWLHPYGKPQDWTNLPWFGEALAFHWFQLCDWDRKWGSNRADTMLRDYVQATDFDHWTALNIIVARLHRERQPFPPALADWAADLHTNLLEDEFKRPGRGPSNRREPPYAREDRNRVFDTADLWLEHFGMTKAVDRLAAIGEYTGVEEDTIRKGIERSRKKGWRRAPWPKG